MPAAANRSSLPGRASQSAQHPFRVLPQVFVTDRTVKFGFQDALDYQIIVNWVIAAHKSQGAYQMGMNARIERSS